MTGTVHLAERAVSADRSRREILARRFELSIEVPRRFFTANADGVSRACLDMARRFEQGGRLLVFGDGAQTSDAEHVAVEFVHPVLVGKRALPAIALTGDPATLARRMGTLARSSDIAMGICVDGGSDAIRAGLALARSAGLLTIVLTATEGRAMLEQTADHLFVVDAIDPLVIQETHETCYHVLWELVHLFLDNRRAP